MIVCPIHLAAYRKINALPPEKQLKAMQKFMKSQKWVKDEVDDLDIVKKALEMLLIEGRKNDEMDLKKNINT